MICTVGIDVSKAKLDVAVSTSPGKFTCLEFPNTPAGHKKLLDRARKLSKGMPLHFCMEVTAAYHYMIGMYLVEAGERVSVENPRRVKHFAISHGATQKTDRADARMIADYARLYEPKAWNLAQPHIRELVALDRRITELKVMQNQETNRLEMPLLPKLVTQGIAASVKGFQKQIVELEKRIKEILKENVELAAQVKLLITVPGIAQRSAVGLLAEVGDIEAYATAQDLAAKLGLNPVHRRSGSSLHGRTRISKAGNAHARSRLYMPTVVATRYNPIIKDFYTKLVAHHKPKKSALIAAERKLVMICYGILKSGKGFNPNHGKLPDAVTPAEKQTLTRLCA